MRNKLVSRALRIAIEARGRDATEMNFHHDNGIQYLSPEFKELRARRGVAQSVGRRGSRHDNTADDRFWATLKREFVDRFRFESRADARRAITGSINNYNAVRRHSSDNNMSPIKWELQFSRRRIQVESICVRDLEEGPIRG